MKKHYTLPQNSKAFIKKSICTGEESLVCITEEGKELPLGSYRSEKEKKKLLAEYNLERAELKEIY